MNRGFERIRVSQHSRRRAAYIHMCIYACVCYVLFTQRAALPLSKSGSSPFSKGEEAGRTRAGVIITWCDGNGGRGSNFWSATISCPVAN
jgi:hypothetical protein